MWTRAFWGFFAGKDFRAAAAPDGGGGTKSHLESEPDRKTFPRVLREHAARDGWQLSAPVVARQSEGAGGSNPSVPPACPLALPLFNIQQAVAGRADLAADPGSHLPQRN
ncbi:hypothetical protein AAFF_G00285240 [Aldrovandia affinis]|uniref:Uncharacterized protein n=1 Tax=Aldrovandia affinis TaxID=143900 RepID=A0AAD7X1T0_9TELE|nr:hypothetical protein AAFF_G00285240 [Aldrovandia affinis]